MKKETEQVLTDLAYNLAESIITKNIILNKGVVHKNTPYIQDVDEDILSKVPKNWGSDTAMEHIELFNDILCNVIEKRLDWYHLEGFTEEQDDSFRFFTKEEIETKNEELYGQD
jgi:hypothetical protein